MCIHNETSKHTHDNICKKFHAREPPRTARHLRPRSTSNSYNVLDPRLKHNLPRQTAGAQKRRTGSSDVEKDSLGERASIKCELARFLPLADARQVDTAIDYKGPLGCVPNEDSCDWVGINGFGIVRVDVHFIQQLFVDLDHAFWACGDGPDVQLQLYWEF